jgi:hypothetical protein
MTPSHHAAPLHRRFDREMAETAARDGGDALAPAPTTTRSVFRDLSRNRSRFKSMNGAKVLLTTLSIRTSGRGNEYLSGWLGKARVVGFKAKEPDRWGNPCWDLYLSEPEQRADDGGRGRASNAGDWRVPHAQRHRQGAHWPQPHGCSDRALSARPRSAAAPAETDLDKVDALEAIGRC